MERHGDGCDRLRTELGYGGVASPNYVRRRLQIERCHDPACMTCDEAAKAQFAALERDAAGRCGCCGDVIGAVDQCPVCGTFTKQKFLRSSSVQP